MTWKIEVAADKTASSWTDYTSVIDRASVRMGGEAFQARVGTGSGFNLDDDAGSVSISGLRVVRMIEDATTPDTTLFRGRIGPKAMARGTRWTGNAKQFDVSCDDYNKDLGGITVDNWSRPSETDVARITALHGAYLNGAYPSSTRRGRATTALSTTYVASGNTVTLPAEVYRDTNPAGVISDILGVTDKECFITVDGELFYDLATSTAYAASLSITDVNPDSDTSFAPIPDGTPGEQDPSELLTRLRLKYGPNNAVVEVGDGAAEALHDRWETTIFAPEITNATKAQRHANKVLGQQSEEEERFTCAIALRPDQVHKIKYGQTLSFRWAAAGVTTARTVRVRRLIWEPPMHPEGFYIAHLELGLPAKLAATTPGGSQPDPPGPFVGGCQGTPAVTYHTPTRVMGSGAGVGIINGAYEVNAQADPGGPVLGLYQFTVTLASTPNPDNLLLILLDASSPSSGTGFGVLSGFESIGYVEFTGGGGAGGRIGGFVGRLDGASFTVRQVDQEFAFGAILCQTLEISGVGALQSASAQSSETETNAPGVAVTPTAGSQVAIVTKMLWHSWTHDGSAGGSFGTPKTGVTELSETDFAGATPRVYGNPGQWVGYRVATSASGSYDVNPTLSPGTASWASITVVLECSESEANPYPGQPVAPEEITADGTTATLQTNYPYQPGSLVVMDKATGQYLVVTESDPDEGEFTLGFTPTAGRVFVVWYEASGLPGTGAGNPLAEDGTGSGNPDPSADTFAWQPVMGYDPTVGAWLVVTDGSGNPLMGYAPL